VNQATRPAQASEQRPVALPLQAARLPSEVTWTPEGHSLVAEWQGERIEVGFGVFFGEAYPRLDAPIARDRHHPHYESLFAAFETHADELTESCFRDAAERDGAP